MTDIWICIGSNLTDARQRIADGVTRLRQLVTDWEMCEPYHTRSEPDDGIANTYLNTVAHCRFKGDAYRLREHIKEIERLCGRIRESDKVALDIDIVIVDNNIVRKRDFDKTYFQKGFKAINNSGGTTHK